MKIAEENFSVSSKQRNEMLDITARVSSIVGHSGIVNGDCVIYCPHTTAAITINENADPDVTRDVLAVLNRLIPERGDYRHAEGNSDAHAKASIIGPSVCVPVSDGRLVLGTWQAIYFCEFDGPRRRKLHVRFVGEEAGGALKMI